MLKAAILVLGALAIPLAACNTTSSDSGGQASSGSTDVPVTLTAENLHELKGTWVGRYTLVSGDAAGNGGRMTVTIEKVEPFASAEATTTNFEGYREWNWGNDTTTVTLVETHLLAVS